MYVYMHVYMSNYVIVVNYVYMFVCKMYACIYMQVCASS